MRQKSPDLILILLFMLIITIPASGGLPEPTQFMQADCGTRLDNVGLCYVKTLIDFPVAFITYYGDHYRFYQQQVDTFNALRLYGLKEKIFPNVLIGQQDWLYYTGEDNIRDYECTAPFNQNELATMRERLLDWQKQLQARGIRFYVVITPNKESIYPQYLPENIRPGRRACRIDQVMAILQETPLKVLDLRAAMQNAAQTAQVYHRTDTHWNATGALIASCEILELIQQDFPDVSIPKLEEYQSVTRAISGDLAEFLPANARFVEQAVQLSPIQPTAILEEGEGRSIISYISGSSLPNVIVFRDSFSDALIPFLSQHFAHVLYIHSFSLDLALVEQAQPDLVIYQIAQRYLTMLR